MVSAHPAMSVILTVYNQELFVPIVLSSLDAQECDVPFEVIVCDDGSSDATRDLVRSWQSETDRDVRYIWQPDRGFRVSRSRNNGIRCAQGDVLVFVDGDSWLRPFFLRQHWEAHRRSGRLVGGGCQTVDLPETASIGYAAVFGAIPESASTDLETRREWIGTERPWMACTSGNLSVERERALFFDEEFQGWGCEDRDLAYRLFRSGLTIHVLEQTGLVHVRSRSQRVAWNPKKGGGHRSIVSALDSKLRLYRKYPGDAMLPSLDAVRYCRLDEATGTWGVGPLRDDASVDAILREFEAWRQAHAGEAALGAPA